MKKISFVLLALPFVFAYNNGIKDSVQKADSANEAKSDTSNNKIDTSTKMSTDGTIAVDQSTADFMVKVADVGMTEVKLGGMAEEKGMNKRVKEFGAMMTKDHSKAGDELKSLARRKN